MDDPIIPFDLQRMFMGDHPALFYLEIVVRVGIIYLYTLVLLRWVGGRSVAQLSMIDFLLVIALGSAVGDAPFYPDVPLFAAMTVITTVVGINKLIDQITERWDSAARVVDGEAVAVASQGRLLPDGLALRDISPTEIKSMLRRAGISNLGQIEAAYLESGGGLSVFRRRDPLPGLRIVPPQHIQADEPLHDTGTASEGRACCTTCGELRRAESVLPHKPCRTCGHRGWTQAALAEDSEPGLLD